MKRFFIGLLVICLFITQFAFAQGESGAINSASYGSTYVIKSDSTLWGCGSEYVGNGTGFKEKQINFVKILDNVRSVSTGGNKNTIAVRKDDTLWGWGAFWGYPVKELKQDPRHLYPIKLNIEDIKKASAATSYILALKNDNSLWICGNMYRGDGTNKKAMDKSGFFKIEDNVIHMFASNDTVFFIKDDLTLWAYGSNNKFQLAGLKLDERFVLKPVKILDNITYITSNPSGSIIFAIDTNKNLYGWGKNGFYTENHGWIKGSNKPVKVMTNVNNCAVDGDNAFIVKNDKSLWAWGYNYEGKKIESKQKPYKVTDNVLSISLGERHASIVKYDNTLWTMGGAYRGGLGYESSEGWYNPLTKVMDNIHSEIKKDEKINLIDENVKKELTYKPYDDDYFATMIGTVKSQNEEYIIEHFIYYKDGDIRVDSYKNRIRSAINIYLDTADITYIRMYLNSNFAQTVEGNWLPLKYMDPDRFYEMENNKETKVFEAKYDYINGEKVLYTHEIKKDDTEIKQWFSLKYHMPIKYYEKNTIKDETTITKWSLREINEEYTILDNYFDDIE